MKESTQPKQTSPKVDVQQALNDLLTSYGYTLKAYLPVQPNQTLLQAVGNLPPTLEVPVQLIKVTE